MKVTFQIGAFALVLLCGVAEAARDGVTAISVAARRAELVIPRECIDALYILKPGAQCQALPDGRWLCKDFQVLAHCEKVKP